MLHHLHLGDQIRALDQRVAGAAPGEHHVQVLALVVEGGEHALGIELLEPQRHDDLVEHHHVQVGACEQLLRERPRALGGLAVALGVLREPGKALTHAMPRHLLAEAGKRVGLGSGDGALHVLHHCRTHAVLQRAQQHPEGGRAPS